MYKFIQQGWIKWLKSDSDDKYVVLLNYIHQKILKKIVSWFPQNINQTKKTLIISNVSWAANQHIRMISEGSRHNEYQNK